MHFGCLVVCEMPEGVLSSFFCLKEVNKMPLEVMSRIEYTRQTIGWSLRHIQSDLGRGNPVGTKFQMIRPQIMPDRHLSDYLSGLIS